jgi:hypothetical protein
MNKEVSITGLDFMLHTKKTIKEYPALKYNHTFNKKIQH